MVQFSIVPGFFSLRHLLQDPVNLEKKELIKKSMQTVEEINILLKTRQ